RGTSGALVVRDQVGKPLVAIAKRYVLSLLLLLEERVAHPEREWQVLLDASGDEPGERRLVLDAFQLVVEAIEHDGRGSTARRKRFVKLSFGVRGIERARDRTSLPRAHFRDEKLWAVGKAQCDAVPG